MAAAAPEGLDVDVSDMITLKSKDGKEFEIERKSASISVLIQTTLDAEPSVKVVNVPLVDSRILAHIIEYMAHHKGMEKPCIPRPLKSNRMSEVCEDPWDAEFIDAIKSNRQDLYDLVLAINYMDIKAMLHLGCATIASIIKGQPLDKMSDLLNPNVPHTPEPLAK